MNVIDHRNPDTDSVCSAIAYAHLENCLGQTNVQPARAGPIDAETALVLQHFAVPVPEPLTAAAGHDLILVDHNDAGPPSTSNSTSRLEAGGAGGADPASLAELHVMKTSGK